MTRQFISSPARRKRVPLLLGISGMAGSGKTFSALRLARGMVSVLGGHTHGLDTETNRMLHYAHTSKCPKDCKNPGHFNFEHTPFLPPYEALAYVDGIRHGLANGATVTVVDSASDMHEGIGGTLDQQATFLDEKCGNDFDKRKRMNAASWNHVKGPLKNAILSMMQLNTVVIMCFRAREKNDWGDKVKSLGTMAIADDNIIFSMTAQALLAPGSEGVPTWDPPLAGEKLQTKRGPFKDLIAGLRGPMNEEMGAIMARWSLGDAADDLPAQNGERSTERAETQPAAASAPESLSTTEAVLQRVREATDLATVNAISSAARGAIAGWTDEQKKTAREAFRVRRQELTA